MNSKPDGGPAFPRPPVQVHEDGKLYSTYKHGQGGMSLRDLFAAFAMAGMFAESDDYTFDGMSRAAYECADAMLKRRDE